VSRQPATGSGRTAGLPGRRMHTAARRPEPPLTVPGPRPRSAPSTDRSRPPAGSLRAGRPRNGSTKMLSSQQSCRTSRPCSAARRARPGRPAATGRGVRSRDRLPTRRQRSDHGTGPSGPPRPATANCARRVVSIGRSAVETPLPAPDAATGTPAPTTGPPSRLTSAKGQPGISRPHQGRELADVPARTHTIGASGPGGIEPAGRTAVHIPPSAGTQIAQGHG
jgi:hypothetical protein